MIELPLLFLVCAMIVSGVIIRFEDIQSKRLAATAINAIGSIVAASIIASFGIYLMMAWAAQGRPAGERADCCGMMDGGFVALFI